MLNNDFAARTAYSTITELNTNNIGGSKKMSKWIDSGAFEKFVEDKKQEKESNVGAPGFKRRLEMQWKNPVRGTVDKPKVYTGRFLPDPKRQYYKRYFYHMFPVGEGWQFHLCPKTFSFDNYCPWCSVTSKLYSGTAADKKSAYMYKRKEKYLGNFYIVDDPRDHENDDKVNGTVKMYEFPGKLEAKIKEQATSKDGIGAAIFDPGDEGFDLIIKITSTKKDPNGKVWPDYGLSDFSRKSYALGTDEEIDAIMEQTMDMDEYLESMERSPEVIEQTLKQLMFWDMVSDEMKKEEKITPSDITKKEKEDDIPEPEVVTVKETIEAEGEELSDSDLMDELNNL